MCKAIKTYQKPLEICVEQNSGKFVLSKTVGNMCKKKKPQQKRWKYVAEKS